jgi:hypothetical protein
MYVNDPSAGSPTEHVCLINEMIHHSLIFTKLSQRVFPPNDLLSNSSLLEAWTVS